MTTEGAGNIIVTQCLLVNEDISITGTPLGILNVGFVDPANQDYHLGALSIGRDDCDNQSGLLVDADNQDRGFDDPAIVNLLGTYDVGADEYISLEYIFVNGFE